jgi:F0F1-type ATP synthase delta subunit
MRTQDLKQLAILISEQKHIDNKVLDYIMKKLQLSDLKLFKKYLDQEITKKKIFVETATDSKALQSDLQHIFPDKVIEISKNESLGAGLKIVDQDNHYDLSVRNRIDQIIENLKN